MTLPNYTIRLLDFHPRQGMYKPGETIHLVLDCDAAGPGYHTFQLMLFRGAHLVDSFTGNREVRAGRNSLEFTLTVPADAPAGYGVEISIADEGAEPIATAFDVLNDWTCFPRYGFVCDFSAGRADEELTITTLARYHINGLQFYDWQYRHDDLLPPADDYLDPLNRPQSLASTRRLIAAAHAHGVAAMPYLAVYAASAAFWRAHPQWMLYDADHKPIPFGEDFLGIMNPVEGGPWAAHLLAECRKVLAALPFDGLHIDQYGDPKEGFDAGDQPVDIARAFGDFVRTASNQHPDRPVLFNAVGNWPIETLAASPTTFNYIEIWPPDTAYTDVARIVRSARTLSGQKPVVIALYIPAERAVNNCLADALIYSSGGSRIELGEDGRLLSDPYFPKHEQMPPELGGWIRRASDLMVRYEEWIGPLVPEAEPAGLNLPEGVSAFFRKLPAGASLSLVNLTGPSSLAWNADHPTPTEVDEFELSLTLDFSPRLVWLVSPDRPSTAPAAVDFVQHGPVTRICIPALKLWNVLLFER